MTRLLQNHKKETQICHRKAHRNIHYNCNRRTMNKNFEWTVHNRQTRLYTRWKLEIRSL